MRIHNDDIAGVGGVRTPATDPQQRVKAARDERDTAPPEDTVQTSAIAAEAAGDPAKIERLRAAVESGTYSVDAKQLAAKIIGEHLRSDT